MHTISIRWNTRDPYSRSGMISPTSVVSDMWSRASLSLVIPRYSESRAQSLIEWTVYSILIGRGFTCGSNLVRDSHHGDQSESFEQPDGPRSDHLSVSIASWHEENNGFLDAMTESRTTVIRFSCVSYWWYVAIYLYDDIALCRPTGQRWWSEALSCVFNRVQDGLLISTLLNGSFSLRLFRARASQCRRQVII